MNDLDHQTALEQLNAEIIACEKCPRLVLWRREVAEKRRRAYRNWTYWGRPVPGFGDPQARILVVGLAPGAHGANRTGRVFTGDASGSFLFRALHRAGFANQPDSIQADDGLALKDLYIAAVCRCAPPDNKPNPDEITNCLPYLQRSIELLPDLTGIIVLGQIAFRSVLHLYRLKGANIPAQSFGHGAFYQLGSGLPWILASYHPSQQNTQTGRLTESMFDEIWARAKE